MHTTARACYCVKFVFGAEVISCDDKHNNVDVNDGRSYVLRSLGWVGGGGGVGGF